MPWRQVIDGKSADWWEVLSSLPQGSVFGLIHFLIYVNDFEEGLTGKKWNFADDTKITSNVTTTADELQFQWNLDILVRKLAN